MRLFLETMLTKKANQLIHSEAALIVRIENGCQLFCLLQAYIMLKKLEDFTQVLCFNFRICFAMLDRTEVKIVEDVLNLSNFVIFQGSEFRIVYSKIFVIGCLLLSS